MIMIKFNQLDRGYYKYKNEYDEAAINVLNSGRYILGKSLSDFETNFSNFVGTRYCVGTNSGLDSLILAFRAIGVGRGDEVIVPANTYIASIIGITANGGTPIFIEPDEYYNINPRLIEQAITSKTKAILAVHLYGQAANMSRIYMLAEKHRIFLVEDCAQSHGASHNNKVTGSWGHVACFSFYPTKNLGAFGDGGAITTDSREMCEEIKMLRNYGSKTIYQNDVVGFNSRLDEMQAALLNIRLSHYDEIRRERSAIANTYLKQINNPKIILPRVLVNSDSVWHVFPVRTEHRDKLIEYLFEKGVETKIHYPIPPHLSKAYKHLGYKQGDFPITESYAKQLVSLPIYEGMTVEEVVYVADAINQF